MSPPGEAYREQGRRQQGEHARTGARRKNATELAREAEQRRMVMIRGEQARLKAEAAARRARR